MQSANESASETGRRRADQQRLGRSVRSAVEVWVGWVVRSHGRKAVWPQLCGLGCRASRRRG